MTLDDACPDAPKNPEPKKERKPRKPKAEAPAPVKAARSGFSPMMEFTMSELLDEIERRSSACLVNVMVVNPVTNEVDYLSRAKGNGKTKTSLLDDLFDSYVADCAECQKDDEDDD